METIATQFSWSVFVVVSFIVGWDTFNTIEGLNGEWCFVECVLYPQNERHCIGLCRSDETER
jgi:hypothetical protein